MSGDGLFVGLTILAVVLSAGMVVFAVRRILEAVAKQRAERKAKEEEERRQLHALIGMPPSRTFEPRRGRMMETSASVLRRAPKLPLGEPLKGKPKLVPPPKPVEAKREEDDGPGFGTGLAAGALLGYAISREEAPSPTVEPASEPERGGEFGGGGASESWDSETTDSGGGGGGNE